MSPTGQDKRVAVPSVSRRAARSGAGLLGVLGSAACVVSMILVPLGVGASAAAGGMAAMSGVGAGAPGGFLGDLLRAGPWLLIGSTVLVVALFAASRRRWAALPAAAAGVALYVGMYAQPSLLGMYVTIAIGYTTWIGLALWVLRTAPQKKRASAARAPAGETSSAPS